jgi:lipoate-protein ligase A
MRTPLQTSDYSRAAPETAAGRPAFVPGGSTRVAWFYDPPSRGSWNMALDEAILLQAVESGAPILRFYQWDQPTVSLGYFQRYQDRRAHEPSIRCPLVRRTTGGGAILHDRELTYSCAVPSWHPLAKRALGLYYAMHESIVEGLAEWGLRARLEACDQNKADLPASESAGTSGCGSKTKGSDAERFLCFQRRSAGDVIFENQKIAGSAQRRCRGAVLQHGSILLARSEHAPELPGICDLSECQIDSRELAERLRTALTTRLQFDFVAELPSAEMMNRAAALEDAKFSAASWWHLR